MESVDALASEHLEHRVDIRHPLLIEEVECPHERPSATFVSGPFHWVVAYRLIFQSSSPRLRDPRTKSARRWRIGSRSVWSSSRSYSKSASWIRTIGPDACSRAARTALPSPRGRSCRESRTRLVREGAHDRSRGVSAVALDDDDLAIDGQILCEEGLDDVTHIALLVVHGHDDRRVPCLPRSTEGRRPTRRGSCTRVRRHGSARSGSRCDGTCSARRSTHIPDSRCSGASAGPTRRPS